MFPRERRGAEFLTTACARDRARGENFETTRLGSLANEYDFLLNTKPMAQWDRYFHILEENDPYRHLKSIHNGDVRMNFDHRKPWVDHVCIQNADVKRTDQSREGYGKPLVNDELQYGRKYRPGLGVT